MPARRKKQAVINLLPREEFAATTIGRVLVWVLSTFRIIVIVTEILVMLAFLSRFWLDAKDTDLNELIKQKQAVLAASSSFEKKFKDTQTRLKIFSEFASEEGVVADAMSEINSRLPPDALLSLVSFKDGGIEIKGISPGEISIQQLTVNLNASELFDNVSLRGIESSEDGQLLEFTITIPPKVTEAK